MLLQQSLRGLQPLADRLEDEAAAFEAADRIGQRQPAHHLRAFGRIEAAAGAGRLQLEVDALQRLRGGAGLGVEQPHPMPGQRGAVGDRGADGAGADDRQRRVDRQRAG